MPKQNPNIRKIEVKGYEIFFNPDTHRFWRFDGDKKINIKSVTTFTGIIDKSQQLIPWAIDLFADHLNGKLLNKEVITELDVYEGSQLHRVRKEEAANLGDQGHVWINQWLSNLEPAIPEHPAVQQVITSFLEYQEKENLEWICSEEVIYYNDGVTEFAGILDAIVKKDGKLVLVDFKTSNAIRTEYYFQSAAYQLAYEWMHDVKIDHRLILRLPKETEDEYIVRMEEKNRKLREKGKKEFAYPKWVPIEPLPLYENEADMLAFKAAVALKNRINQVENDRE